MTKRPPKSPRVLLLEDHRHLESLLDRLRACVRADDREAMGKAWRRAEKVLLRHLDVEEMFVFPVLQKEHGAEVDGLRNEHDEIRRWVGEIGLALELHTLRCETVESFSMALHEHAQRENTFAYALAERELPISAVRAIAARVRETLTALRGDGAPRSSAAATR